MKMSSIRAIKDGNVVCICQCLFVMKAKPNKLYILFHFNSEKHKCHFAMAKSINFNNPFFFFFWANCRLDHFTLLKTRILSYEKHWDYRTDLFHGGSDLQQEVIGLQFAIQETHHNLFSLKIYLHLTVACGSDPIPIPPKPIMLNFYILLGQKEINISSLLLLFPLSLLPPFFPTYFPSFLLFLSFINLFIHLLCYLKPFTEHQNGAKHAKFW